ncbi:MAG TPA: prepilin-type N-terminal cleavage/methylation domain-containing protein [Candidatus Dormibacteraeota bacterium]|nr:prepilin-type N-terminal cleavage/methylation domain-containing protein [Candidatus Dormibacteraeota bacterium]
MKLSLDKGFPWRRLPRDRSERGKLGFTLIELMLVITIILILIGIAAIRYDKVLQHSKEAVLRADLRAMRDAIDNFTLDKQAAPQSLDDLQQAGYLRSVPVDPMTNAKDWVAQFDSVVLSADQSTTGMVDVHSNSPRVSPFDNTPYNEW